MHDQQANKVGGFIGLELTALVLDSAVVLKFGDDRKQELRIQNDFIVVRANADRVIGRFSPYSYPPIAPAHITELSRLGARHA